jgi:hypothetical protein
MMQCVLLFFDELRSPALVRSRTQSSIQCGFHRSAADRANDWEYLVTFAKRIDGRRAASRARMDARACAPSPRSRFQFHYRR